MILLTCEISSPFCQSYRCDLLIFIFIEVKMMYTYSLVFIFNQVVLSVHYIFTLLLVSLGIIHKHYNKCLLIYCIQVDFHMIQLQMYTFPGDTEVTSKERICMRSEPTTKTRITQQILRFLSLEGLKQILIYSLQHILHCVFKQNKDQNG